MASLYPSISALLPPESTPESVPSVDQACELLGIGPTTGGLLQGSSRHGWLAWAVRTIATRLVIPDLEFLYCEPWASPQGCYVALFKGPEIDRVMDSISRVLARAESHPGEFAELLQDGSDAEAILDDVRNQEASLHPSIDDSCTSGYFFRYLKSFRWFCENAKAKNHAVLYTQWDGG